MKLDSIDKQILDILQSDSSISVTEVAERVNLSQPPCWRRIKKMEDEGIIDKKVSLINRKKIGLNVVVYAEVKLSANGRQEVGLFEEKIRDFAEVTECYVMLGRIDFLIKVVTKDIETYEQFFRDHLSQLPGVAEINSMAALTEVKHTTELPIHLA